VRRLLALLFLAVSGRVAEDDSVEWRLGERMYRQGLLPSGQPMRGSVENDIPVDGARLRCVSCHLRSGLGSVEGGVNVRPISGARLYQPLLRSPKTSLRRKPRAPESHEPEVVRPAYTDTTLARALREGVDPSGRALDPAMPRYSLDDRDMAVLVRYLKSLSSHKSPGTDGTTIRFATIVTEGVDPLNRDAMLATLEAYVQDHNAKPSRPAAPEPKDAFVLKKPRYPIYPRLEIVRWDLKGASETWRSQLDTLQRAAPVFGLLGGMAAGEWQPIHEFCEDAEIPCLFPITDLPVISATDWQTLYFSKGLFEEGAAAARYLHGRGTSPSDLRVIELLNDDERARAVACGFEDAWRALGNPSPERKVLSPLGGQETALESLGVAGKRSVALLWVNGAELEALRNGIKGSESPRIVFVSAGLLGEALGAIPVEVRERTYITYPRSLPEEQTLRITAVERWLKERGVPWTRPDVQSRACFMGWMLSAALNRMRDGLHRDYLLDLLDMAGDQTFAIAPYTRLSFGPGQRYASKGCYIVQLGPQGELLRKSEWVLQGSNDARGAVRHLAPIASRNSLSSFTSISPAVDCPSASTISTCGSSGVSSQVSWRSRPRSSGRSLSP
jgi:hypothetical protein